MKMDWKWTGNGLKIEYKWNVNKIKMIKLQSEKFNNTGMKISEKME